MAAKGQADCVMLFLDGSLVRFSPDNKPFEAPHGIDGNAAGSRHIYRNNILGPTAATDFGGGAHTDGYQSNAGTTDSFMENNWHVENPGSDSHLYQDEVPGNHHITMLRNVSVRSGDRLNGRKGMHPRPISPCSTSPKKIKRPISSPNGCFPFPQTGIMLSRWTG